MMRHIWLFLLAGAFPAVSQQILVPPYLQPGNAYNLSKEQKVVIWQTDSTQGTFTVHYTEGTTLDGATSKVNEAKVTTEPLTFFKRTSYLHRATLSGLDFDKEYTYRVTTADKVISTSTFMTRTKHPKTRFIALGDVGTASPQQKAIAYQMYQVKPQFVLTTGDLAYNNGLEREFRVRFFPPYTVSEPSMEKGAPLMQSIPFYLFVGNHDLYGADLGKFPDGLAIYYYADSPMNGPITSLTTEVSGPPDRVRAFKKATDGRFPKINNFSFDHGNVHITVLDANSYTNPLDPALVEWMKRDIGSSKADWKIVTHHHPGFNTSKAHYDYQQMRLLSPVLEELGVDLVLTSHVHNYQRSKPLKFSPQIKDDHYVISEEGRVDGKFTLDEVYDGVTNTKPKGIIYVVSGSGGAALYDTPLSNKPELWVHEPASNWVPFMVKLISDTHSFTLIETDQKTLSLKQIDLNGAVIDEFKLTK